MRHSISTDSVPSTATMKRQPKGFSPNIHSPSAMTHLPTGGCTTYPGASGTAEYPSTIRSLMSLTLDQSAS